MFNKKLIQLRKENNLSQLEIAKLLKMSKTGYAGWQQGRSEPNIDNIKKLCVIYGITSDELLEIDSIKQRNAIAINNSLNNNSGKIDIKF